ncbi:calcineurin-like metallo-phosphoesterase superfamily protein [Tanacetum coccineum]
MSASSAPSELVSRIAFGSCANQSSPQPIWDAILEYKPHVFIWLGDNIYGDIRRPFKLFGNDRTIGPWKNVPRFVPSSYDQMKSKYDIAKTNHGYARLRTIAKVIGTWDDHDYGLNDAGKEFKHKDINQKLMLDFLDEPPNSPRRKQAGVYASYTFGPEGRRIKVILLDTRYHRDPLRSDGTILGTAQWTWLKRELNSQPSEITIIGSSIQVISNLSACTGPLFYMESWGRFPSERKRLFKLISDSKRDGVFFISGDVHFGEITRFDCATGYPLYDITASGLTQAVEKVIPSFLHFVVRFLAWITPTTMRVINNNCKHKSCTYGQPNFGVIEVNWDANPVSLRFEVRGVNGEAVNSVTTSLSDLQAKKGGFNNVKGGKQHCSLEVDLPWLLRHRLAILFSLFVAVLIVLQVGVLYVAISLMVKCLRKCKLD